MYLKSFLKLRYCLVIVSLLLLSNCASKPTMEELSKADYGKFVDSPKCLEIAKTFISIKMKDPSSVQYNNVYCTQGWQGKVPILGVPNTYGYRFTGNINAKNSYGGYTGFLPFSGIVRDDGFGPKVIRYCITTNSARYGRTCLATMVN